MEEKNQLLALVIVVSTCITFLWCCCICKLSIDAFIIGVICILLSSWFKLAADVCDKIELGSMSDICVLRMFVIEKLLLFVVPLPPPPLPKFIWFIIPAVTDADGMFWIWFDIGWAKACCWLLEFGSSSLALVEFLTWGGWLWTPVVLIIRPWAVMQRARHVVTRYERLQSFKFSRRKKQEEKRKSILVFFF